MLLRLHLDAAAFEMLSSSSFLRRLLNVCLHGQSLLLELACLLACFLSRHFACLLMHTHIHTDHLLSTSHSRGRRTLLTLI